MTTVWESGVGAETRTRVAATCGMTVVQGSTHNRVSTHAASVGIAKIDLSTGITIITGGIQGQLIIEALSSTAVATSENVALWCGGAFHIGDWKTGAVDGTD